MSRASPSFLTQLIAVVGLTLSTAFLANCAASQQPGQARGPEDQLQALSDQADENPNSPEIVLAYLEQLTSWPGFVEAEPDYWQVRVKKALGLLAGVLPKLDPRRASHALVMKARLLALDPRGYAAPGVDQTLRAAFAKQATWESGTALIGMLAARRARSEESATVCSKTYDVGLAEHVDAGSVVGLARTCGMLAPEGQTPEAAMPNIDWNAVRAALDQMADDEVRRQREHRERVTTGQCVVDPSDGRYRHCVEFKDGQCYEFGLICEN